MNKDLKKIFFTSLLAVLLVVSNLIGLKLTNFFDLTISVSFITYPFTFLCTLLIFDASGRKAAYQSILMAIFLQAFLIIPYTLAVSLGNQAIMPDIANSVNEVFKVNGLSILSSLLAFTTSHYILIYIYDNFKRFGRELYGIVIGLLAALFLDSTIFLLITLNGYEAIFIVNMFLSHVIVSIIMITIMTIIFYILKEKNNSPIYIDNNLDIVTYHTYTSDKSIDEVINDKDKNDYKVIKEVEKSKATNTSKTVSKKPINNSKKTEEKKYQTKNNVSKNVKKVVKNSKPKVNKENK